MKKSIMGIFIGFLLFIPAGYFYITECYTCIGLFIFPILFIPIGIGLIFNSFYDLLFIGYLKDKKKILKLLIIKYIILILCFVGIYYFLYLEKIADIFNFIILPLMLLFIIKIFLFYKDLKLITKKKKII